MDQQEGSELQDEYSDDKKDKGESFDKHQDISSQMTRKRMNILIILGLLILLILLIYHNVKQDNFDTIEPSFMKGPQREMNVLSDTEQPTMFSGDLDDLPDLVVDSIIGRVITVDGVPYMWQPRASQDNCYKTCKDETRIECDHYFFDKVRHKCYMFGKNSTKPVTRSDLPVDQQQTQKHLMNVKGVDTVKRFKREIKIQLNDIPDTVVKGVFGRIINVDGVPYLWRPRASQDNCFKTCEQETRIGCVRYFFDKVGKKCFIIGKKSTSTVSIKIKELPIPIPRPRTTTTPPPPPPPPPATPATIIKIVHVQPKSNDLTELKLMIEKIQGAFKSAVESLHDGKERHDSIVEGLQAKQNIVQNTIGLLSDNVKNLNKVKHRLVDKINVMDSRQQTLTEQVKNMAGYEQQIASAMANVNKKVTHMDDDLDVIKQVNEKVSRQLSGEEAANPEFNRQIIALRRQMIDLMSRVEMNPTVLKMTKNQRVLAEALEAVDREIAINERRLAHIDESTGDWAGRLMAEEEHRKALSDAIQTLSKAVKDVRNDVIRLQNPQSAENIEKTKQIRQMRSDINILEKSNAELKQDVARARADMTRLIRDLMNVQVSTHDSKTSIMALVEANKNLAMEYHQQKTDQNQMITQIQTLATVYRSVLAALHSLELKQIQVMHNLGRNENEIRRVSTEVLAAKTDVKKDQNLALIKTMKTFQTKLLNQVDQLREDLLKLQKQIEIKSQASKMRGAYKEGYQDGKLKLLHDIHVEKPLKKQVHITITHHKP
ncbi:FK506-binding protein 5-like isoform X1 [Gigantopelta aegis]|uniref:FK506-binding protein 5-like isoform X1 n=1 Tax=Gigantopelta aegis TaxID=1735272 RepID=UPI001B8874FC|nr:FK506-binding protein 5-like isoform X1 [Gigantopelta aegis]